MEFMSFNPVQSYMTPTMRSQTSSGTLPRLVDNLNTTQEDLARSYTMKRSLTTMPWRPATYYRSGYHTPRTPITEVQVAPLSTRASLSELEAIKTPTVFSAARNALYTRYTPNDWLAASLNNFTVSERSRQMAERLRYETLRLGRETDDKTKRAQEESGKKLGERITDTSYWKKELAHETDNMVTEINKLTESKRVAEKLLCETENPLHITQECLYNREKRQGVDLVHDCVERELLSEVDEIKTCQDKLRRIIDQATTQLSLDRAAQHELDRDCSDKFFALQLDESAHSLKNHSPGINYHNGVERVDNTISIPETWAKFSDANVKRSQAERESSRRLRDAIEALVNECTQKMWTQWNRVNTALTQRTQECTDARNKTESHLNMVCQEIFDMEKNIEFIKKCIQDKEAPLMVAHTRLDTRLRRPNMDLCRDPAQHRLVEEVYEIRESVAQLKNRLAEAEDSMQALLRSKSVLEHDLSVKNNSLAIDREKCQGLRKTFPIGPKVTFN